MNPKVVVVSASPRKNGNSDFLAQEFARGAREAGCSVEKIDVRELNLKFCIGCLYCQDHDRCVLDDGVNAVLATVQQADVLAFATPIYYYEMCGQLKTFLDRLNPLYSRENRFRDVYLLAASAEDSRSAMDGAIKGVQGWIDCFEGVKLRGVIYGTGVQAVGEIRGTAAANEAYELGKSLNERR